MRKPRHVVPAAIALLSLCSLAWAHEVSEKMVGNVHKPAKVPATDERVKSLRVPSGFRIAKFAEGLEKPRMIAVADDAWCM